MTEPQVFGRYTGSRWLPAIWDWLTSGDVTARAMARNLIHDHTVSEARQRAFEQFLPKPCSSRDLRRAIDDYIHQRISVPRPDFLDPGLNGQNQVPNHGLSLARVVDITSLIAVFQWQSSTGREPLNSFPLMADDEMFRAWLAEQISAGPSGTERLVGALLGVWSEFQRLFPRRPTWATTWQALAPHIDQGPDRWFQVWGVPKWAFPRWLIVLKYEGSQVGTLLRPTVLDFGWRPFYFPPPPQAPLSDGGYAVDLRTSPPPTTLLPTFLHEPIDYSLEHWKAAGCRCGWTTRAVRIDLVATRQLHHRLLADAYGQDIYNWMPECV